MPTPNSFSRTFTLTALRANGSGIRGAQIRLLNAQSVDVTANFFNNPTDGTGADGVFVRSISPLNTTPAGVHTIQVTAPGYELWSLVTGSTFTGNGTYVANLIRVAGVIGAYSITSPNTAYLSALYPIVYTVDTPQNYYDWELIRFRLTHLDGRTSVLEAPVDPATGNAIADVHSRVRLRPRPHLVPDTAASIVDPDFSDFVTLSVESLTTEGTFFIPGGFIFGVANMVPNTDTNDLNDYASGAADGTGLVRWISLLDNPVVFRGFYFDTMIWLANPAADYTLHTEYLDSAGVRVGLVIDTPMDVSDQVQRVRVNASPDASVRSARLWVTDGADVISKTLTLTYRG